MDEFKEEREKIKTASPEQKWKYFKDYYLKWVIAGVATLIVVIILLVDILTKKENMLTVMFVNFADQGSTTANIEMPFTNGYLENPKKQEITLETNIYLPSDTPEIGNDSAAETYSYYQSQQRFSMLLMAGELNLVITDENFIMGLAEQNYTLALDRVYSEDELTAFGDRLVYYEGTPIAIRMDESALIRENLVYKGENAENAKICAAFSSLKGTDLAKQFLSFID